MSSENPQLLFTFFTRDNLGSDSWIAEGLGPMRRYIDIDEPKKEDGSWNTLLENHYKYHGSPLMPNPDAEIEALVKPSEDQEFDLVGELSKTENGVLWLKACETYLQGNNKEMPAEMPFSVLLTEIDHLYYMQEMGSYVFSTSHPTFWDLTSLPEGMISGQFRPGFRQSTWESDSEKIGVVATGGAIDSYNKRWGYKAQSSLNQICLSVPWEHQLLGDMDDRTLSKENCFSDEPSYNDGHFPRTHFMEYVFAKHCSREEPSPSPGIRVEVLPENLEKRTFAREKAWAKETALKYAQKHYQDPEKLLKYFAESSIRL